MQREIDVCCKRDIQISKCMFKNLFRTSFLIFQVDEWKNDRDLNVHSNQQAIELFVNIVKIDAIKNNVKIQLRNVSNIILKEKHMCYWNMRSRIMLLISSKSQYQTSETSPSSSRARLIAKKRSFEFVTITWIKCYFFDLLDAIILFTHLKKKLNANAFKLYEKLESSESSDHVLDSLISLSLRKSEESMQKEDFFTLYDHFSHKCKMHAIMLDC